MYVGLIAVGVLAYANSLSGPFIFDDIPAIVENADIREVLPLWRSPAESDRPSINSRPVVRLSLSLNNAFGGLEVRGYHLANIGFHILCALLLAVCLQRTLVLSSMAPSVSKYAESLASASPPPRLRLGTDLAAAPGKQSDRQLCHPTKRSSGGGVLSWHTVRFAAGRMRRSPVAAGISCRVPARHGKQGGHGIGPNSGTALRSDLSRR